MVADVARGHEDADRTTPGISDGMQPGVHAAPCSTDQAASLATASPFSDRGLLAVRCALGQAASVMTVLCLPLSAAGPIMIRANTPLSLQRFQRLQRVLAGPCSLGAPHHRNPVRLAKVMPLGTRRSSTRGLPWLFGSEADQKTVQRTVFPTNGCSRAIRASVSQKRLLIVQSPRRG